MKYRIFGITAAVLMIAAVILCLYIDHKVGDKDYTEVYQRLIRNKDKLNDDPEAFKFIVSKYSARLE